jgi:hypothetical protein
MSQPGKAALLGHRRSISLHQQADKYSVKIGSLSK